MLPFAGVRIVEAAQMISVPMATSILADQGAEVIKVEPANGVGDRLRYLGDRRNRMATVFHSVNRNKRSVTLDTKTPAGLEALLRLADTADVFIQNFRPGVAERMGIGHEVLRERNPELIYVSVSGFGPTGPYSDQMVYDFVIQGLVGIATREGSAETPRLSSQLVVDKATALTVSQAISAALYQRASGGGGQYVEVDMLGAGLQFFWPDGMSDHTLLGDDYEAVRHMSASYDVRPTADGYVSMNLASKTTWSRLLDVFDDDTIRNDPRFATYADRQANAEALLAAVDAVLAYYTTDQIIERLRQHDVPGGRILPLDEVHLDPQVIHSQALVETDEGPMGPRREPRPAARFGGERAAPARSAPHLGADTNAVLSELGYDADELVALAEGGVTQPRSAADDE